MKKFSIHTVQNVFAVAVVIGLGYMAYLTTSISVVPEAKAGTSENISGWAWSRGAGSSAVPDPVAGPYTVGSSSGLGWISLNSIDCDQDNNKKIDTACGSNNLSVVVENYGVDLSTNNIGSSGGVDYFSGRAWGENIGWISFNQTETSSCGAPRAQINWSTGKVTGWARALSGSTVAGAWDGCISLSGVTSGSTPQPYGVGIDSSDSTRFTGYAWGGDVLGWIDFAPKVKGAYVGTEFDGGATTCTTPDVDLSTLAPACSPINEKECDTEGKVVGGFQMGYCPKGGTAPVYGCKYTCPTTTVSPPSTTGKKKFWEF